MKKDLLNEMNSELKDLESSQLIHMITLEKLVLKQPFNKEMTIVVNHGSNQTH